MDRIPITSRKNAFSLPSEDQALLDSLVKASLAEIRAPRIAPRETSEAEGDPTKRFLASAMAFLAERPDRGELIERLRKAVAGAPPPREDAAKQPANQPPEAGDVRKDS